MATLTKVFSDIDFTFTPKPVTGDVALSYDDQAVIRSVVNLLLTNFYERPFQPNLGSNIDALLFEPITNLTASMLETEIRNVMNNYEPRATIQTLTVTPDEVHNLMSVYMEVFIGNNTTPTAVNLILQRSR